MKNDIQAEEVSFMPIKMRKKVIVSSHPKKEDSMEVGIILEEEEETYKWNSLHVEK